MNFLDWLTTTTLMKLEVSQEANPILATMDTGTMLFFKLLAVPLVVVVAAWLGQRRWPTSRQPLLVLAAGVVIMTVAAVNNLAILVFAACSGLEIPFW
jgi:hypothetical protein